MGLFSSIFGSGSSSGDKEFKDVKTTTKVSNNNDSVQVRSRSTLISGDDKGTHETVFSKTTSDLRTGKTSYEEGWHGNKSNK